MAAHHPEREQGDVPLRLNRLTLVAGMGALVVGFLDFLILYLAGVYARVQAGTCVHGCLFDLQSQYPLGGWPSLLIMSAGLVLIGLSFRKPKAPNASTMDGQRSIADAEQEFNSRFGSRACIGLNQNAM